ncbi:hypothetical protein [Micromonospora sp. CPCC 206061]|uniref:hypothetical protein n=1 Tax=Micromonospora sp. CPCC 206061 TaxID=3122410 RepID=UPI002FF3C6A5
MRIPERLRRPDWLAETQSTVVFVLVVLAVVGAAGIAMFAVGENLVVEVPASAVAGASDALRPGVTVDAEGTLDVVVARPDRAELAAAALTSLPTYLVVVTMLTVLYAVVRRARREDPFLAVTVNRLRLLGLVALVGGPLAAIVEMVATLDLTRRVTGNASATLEPAAIGLWMLAGFGFLAVAEIVNRGRALRAELDTVI